MSSRISVKALIQHDLAKPIKALDNQSSYYYMCNVTLVEQVRFAASGKSFRGDASCQQIRLSVGNTTNGAGTITGS